MFKKLFIVLIGIILISIGAFWSFQDKSKSKRQAVILNNLTKETLNKVTPTPSPTPLVANFHETGTILNWDLDNSNAADGDWTFLYESATEATASARLIFDKNSLCQVDENKQPCNQTLLKNGEKVKVSAFKQEQRITVLSLEKVTPDQLEGALP